MEPTLYKTIELENGYKLCILDTSRKISEDAFVVKMKAVIGIEIKKELFFDPIPSEISLEDIQAVLGDKIDYEHEVERNFIMAAEKDGCFKDLVSTFLDNLGQYVAKPQFPGKFVLKEYKNKTD